MLQVHHFSKDHVARHFVVPSVTGPMAFGGLQKEVAWTYFV